jgi:hypothetical protein
LTEDNNLPEVTHFEDFDSAWRVFTTMEATRAAGWQHLPFPGGVLDQPELLMDEVFQCASLARKIRKALSGDSY